MVDFDRTDLNIATQKKMEGILCAGLGPIIAQLLRKTLGPAWLDEINRRRAETPQSRDENADKLRPIKSNNGRASWDANQLLHTIRENTTDLEEGFRGKPESVITHCYELTGIRNRIAHDAGEQLKVAASTRNIINYAERAAKLLLAFKAYREKNEVEAILDSLIEGGTRPAGSEDAQPAPPPQSVVSAEPAVELPSPRAISIPAEESPASPPIDFGFTDSVEEALPARRVGDLPAPGIGVACFPITDLRTTVPSEEECLGAITTMLHPDGVNPGMALGLDTEASNAFLRIIADVRAYEPDAAKAGLCTRSIFDPLTFIGTSYGLALAISDRTIRYGINPRYRQRRIVATGIVAKRKGGVLVAVDGFLHKIDIVAKHMSAEGAIFVFPGENYRLLDDAGKAKLARLETLGIEWRTLEHVNEIDSLFCPPLKPDDKATTATGTKATIRASALPTRRSSGLVKGALVAAASGIVFLVGLYGYARYSAQDIDRIGIEQASSERLTALLAASTRLTTDRSDPTACAASAKAVASLTAVDRQHLDPVHERAIKAAADCTEAMETRARKLDALVAAAKAYDDSNTRLVQNMAAARTAFADAELADGLSPEQASAAKTGDQAVDHLATSEAKARTFGAAFLDWARDRDSRPAMNVMLDAYAAMDPFDRDLARKNHGSEIETAATIARERDARKRLIDDAVAAARSLDRDTSPRSLTALEQTLSALDGTTLSLATEEQRVVLHSAANKLSDARWRAFAAAAETFRQNGDSANAAAVAAAYDVLTDEDRRSHSAELGAFDDVMVAARQASVDAEGRLSRLEAAAERIANFEGSKEALVAATEQLATATTEVEELDQNDLSERQAAAMQAGRLVKAMMDGSPQRIGTVGELAEIARTAPRNTVPPKVKERMTAARLALTPYDRAKLTPEQKGWVTDVCLAKARARPGRLPANPELECKNDPDFDRTRSQND